MCLDTITRRIEEQDVTDEVVKVRKYFIRYSNDEDWYGSVCGTYRYPQQFNVWIKASDIKVNTKTLATLASQRISSVLVANCPSNPLGGWKDDLYPAGFHGYPGDLPEFRPYGCFLVTVEFRKVHTYGTQEGVPVIVAHEMRITREDK